MIECIILVGLQGAGKTTLYRQRFAASHDLNELVGPDRALVRHDDPVVERPAPARKR